MTVVANDTFTDSAGTDLASHTPETGSWTEHGPSAAGSLVINSNNVRVGANAESVYYQAAPGTSEYDVEVTISPGTMTDFLLSGVAGRIDTAASTFYRACYTNVGGTNKFALEKVVAGAATTLGTFNATLSGSTTLKLQIRNAAKKVFINGTERISSADNAITATGRGGLYGSMTGFDGIGAGSGRGVLFDNFTVTDLSSGVSRTATDSVGLSDTASSSPSTGRLASDSLGTSESIARQVARPRTATDSVSVSDSAERHITPAYTQGHNTGFLLLFEVAATYLLAQVESVTISDVANRAIAQSVAATDTLGAADAVTRGAQTFTRTDAESVTVADFAAASAGAVFSFATESVAVNDTAERVRTMPRGITDTAGLTDTVTRGATTWTRAITDRVSITDEQPELVTPPLVRLTFRLDTPVYTFRRMSPVYTFRLTP